jgi:hypothetical protein
MPPFEHVVSAAGLLLIGGIPSVFLVLAAVGRFRSEADGAIGDGVVFAVGAVLGLGLAVAGLISIVLSVALRFGRLRRPSDWWFSRR